MTAWPGTRSLKRRPVNGSKGNILFRLEREVADKVPLHFRPRCSEIMSGTRLRKKVRILRPEDPEGLCVNGPACPHSLQTELRFSNLLSQHVFLAL